MRRKYTERFGRTPRGVQPSTGVFGPCRVCGKPVAMGERALYVPWTTLLPAHTGCGFWQAGERDALAFVYEFRRSCSVEVPVPSRDFDAYVALSKAGLVEVLWAGRDDLRNVRITAAGVSEHERVRGNSVAGGAA